MSEDSAYERIRLRAYELYVARGQHPGREEEDWLQAEREVMTEGPPVASTERQQFPSEGEPRATSGRGQADGSSQPRRSRKDTPRRARG